LLLGSEFMTTLLAFMVGWSLLRLPPALMAEYRKSGRRQTQQRLVNFIGKPYMQYGQAGHHFQIHALSQNQ
jgi:hypothetical protein